MVLDVGTIPPPLLLVQATVQLPMKLVPVTLQAVVSIATGQLDKVLVPVRLQPALETPIVTDGVAAKPIDCEYDDVLPPLHVTMKEMIAYGLTGAVIRLKVKWLLLTIVTP